jgi:uncharacterized protein (UPF0335 family)
MANLNAMREEHRLVGGRAIQAHEIKSIIERVETREKARKELIDNISKLYMEAKGHGYDIKALRTIIRLRKIKEGDRAEQEAVLLDTYKQALGMLV